VFTAVEPPYDAAAAYQDYGAIMPEQYRRSNEDDYRRGHRRGWSDRFRDEARPWLRDEEPRWRPEDRDDRSAYATGERSWRDQADGSYERSSRQGNGDSSFERERGWMGREERDYRRGSYGQERDWGRGSERGRGHVDPDDDEGRDRFSDSSAAERYRQWRGAFNPGYFEGDHERPGDGASRGSGATYAGARSSAASARDMEGDGRSPRFAGRGPKGYQRSDDRIREDVCERLMDDSDVDASDVTVEVAGGEVRLSGTVEDRWQKRRAEDIAEHVSGVSEVTNNIRLSRLERGQDSQLLSGQSTSGMRSSPSPASGSSKANKPTTSAV
jgi:osmotically-inducible protein OsmY